jgi:hypothetical protein
MLIVRQLSMRYILYAVAWALMFASGTSCLRLYKGTLKSDQLPRWLFADFGRKYAYPLLFVIWFSALSLIAFGVSQLTWYWVPLGIMAGLVTSAVLQVLCGDVPFAIAGPAVLVCLQVGLWVGAFSESDGSCACGVAQWSRVSPSDGGFSVLMPLPVSEHSTTNDTKIGRVVKTYLRAQPSQRVSFEVCRNQVPTHVDTKGAKALEAGLKGAVGNDGRLVSIAETSLLGYPGREGRIEKGSLVITARMYLVGHEVFQLVSAMPKRHVCSKHLSQFLDSFDVDTRASVSSSAEPDGPADGSQPFRPETNRMSGAAGSRR